MALFRSTRLRRIDRALSSVLSAIDDEQNAARRACETWRELDELDIATNGRRIAAYERADKLETQWRERVARAE